MAGSSGGSDVEERRGSARQQGQDQKEEGRRLAKHDDEEGLGLCVYGGEREGGKEDGSIERWG